MRSRKWDHLKGLTYSVAVGTEAERIAALRQQVSLHIINRENVQWLVEQSGLPFDYDMIVVDELSSFKSYQAKRFRSLMKVRPMVKRIVGLTGTPSANGLMDLWAEFRLLDLGKRLGRFITHYRDEFFLPDKRNGQQVFTYKPKPGAEDEIYRRIADITDLHEKYRLPAHAGMRHERGVRRALPHRTGGLYPDETGPGRAAAGRGDSQWQMKEWQR